MRVFKRNQINQSIETTSLEEVMDFIKKTVEIECDTETWGFDPHSKDILCIQFGNKTNQYLIEWDDALVEHIKPIMEDNNKLFLDESTEYSKFNFSLIYFKSASSMSKLFLAISLNIL